MSRRVAAATSFLACTAAANARAQVAPPAPDAIAVGEWRLAPVAQVRTRGEYRHDLDDEDRGFWVERVRLGVDAEHGPLEARVVLQDARVIDLAAGTDALAGPPAQASTGAYEAWVQVETSSSRPSFVRVGRQAVAWGEGRLLGADDASPAGRSLDAVRARLVASDGSVELLGAILEDPPSVVSQASIAPTAYGELFGARGEWAFDPLFAIEGYALARLAQANPFGPIDNLGGSVEGETYTFALRLFGRTPGWTWGAEAAYELGRASLLSEDRAGWAAAAHVAHTFERVYGSPTAELGAAYASGDDGGHRDRAFDPLLPDTHVWHGAMDVFAWSNEEEASARLSVIPVENGVASIEYRYARLAQAGGAWRSSYLATIGRAPGNTASELGHEIDAALSWSPWEPLSIGAGYSALVLGDGARGILGIRTAARVSHFAYAGAALQF